jgi:hypothetical protein
MAQAARAMVTMVAGNTEGNGDCGKSNGNGDEGGGRATAMRNKSNKNEGDGGGDRSGVRQSGEDMSDAEGKKGGGRQIW